MIERIIDAHYTAEKEGVVPPCSDPVVTVSSTYKYEYTLEEGDSLSDIDTEDIEEGSIAIDGDTTYEWDGSQWNEVGGGGYPEPTGTKSISITSNGTTTHNIKDYASAQITADVPNTYAASDEGKVVDNGALVAQTSQSITANGTYDTTLKNSVSVDVPVPPGYIIPTGTKSIAENGTGIDVTEYAAVDVAVSGGGGISWDDIAANSEPSGTITLTGTTIGDNAFTYRVGASEWTLVGNNVTSLGKNAFKGCSKLKAVYLPNLTSYNTTGGAFESCSELEVVDYGLMAPVRGSTFTNSTKFKTLILRKADAVAALPYTNTFNGTCFKSGGSGGTIYIPKALYDHLGDGSALDYKAATNWATYEGYGTITWAKIEGSIYE